MSDFITDFEMDEQVFPAGDGELAQWKRRANLRYGEVKRYIQAEEDRCKKQLERIERVARSAPRRSAEQAVAAARSPRPFLIPTSSPSWRRSRWRLARSCERATGGKRRPAAMSRSMAI